MTLYILRPKGNQKTRHDTITLDLRGNQKIRHDTISLDLRGNQKIRHAILYP